MDTIYRIEDAQGYGPYRGVYDIQDDFTDSQRHPLPSGDSKLKETASHLFGADRFDAPNFIFGYSTLDQLRAWFYRDEPLRTLHEHGYKLLHLQGECYHGNSQAIINRNTMKVLSEVSLLSLLTTTTTTP